MSYKNINSDNEIRVIAPSRSLSIIGKDVIKNATTELENMGYSVSIAKNAYNYDDDYKCASISDRVSDIHDAFLDKNVKCILTAIGGYNSNQLLDYIDYNIIKNNPKILCGFSDITALLNAIYAKTGMITYYGPHFSSFGMKKGLEYTRDNFQKRFCSDEYYIECSDSFSDDAWYLDQDNRKFIKNEGLKIVNYGESEGTILGGNLCTLNLLQGTEYMPDADEIILFIEDDDLSKDLFLLEFDRNLESLLQTEFGKKIKGIIIGRCQIGCSMTDDKWYKMLKNKEQLKDIPVLFNADFGHTTPIFTFPIGGKCKMKVTKEEISIKISNYKSDGNCE